MKRGWIVLLVVALASVVGGILLSRPGGRSAGPSPYPELDRAADWLEDYVGPETIVYAPDPVVSKRTGSSHRPVPAGSYDRVLDEIVTGKGDFLVVDAGLPLPDSSLISLVLDKPVPRWETRVRPVYLDDSDPPRRTMVFRVVRPGGVSTLPSEPDMPNLLAALHHQPNHFFHGILAMRAESWQAAAGEFAFAMKADTTNAVAFNNRAWCLFKAETSLGDALASSRYAVGLEPHNLDFLDTLAEILRALGEEAEVESVEARVDSLCAAGAAP